MKHLVSAGVIMAILVSALSPINAWAEAIVIGTVGKSPLSGSAPGGTKHPRCQNSCTR